MIVSKAPDDVREMPVDFIILHLRQRFIQLAVISRFEHQMYSSWRDGRTSKRSSTHIMAAMMASPGRLPLGRGSRRVRSLGMLCALALSTSASVAQAPKACAAHLVGWAPMQISAAVQAIRRSRQSSSASAVNRRKRVVAAGSAEAMLTYREDRSSYSPDLPDHRSRRGNSGIIV